MKYRIGNALPMGATVIDVKSVQFVRKSSGRDAGLILIEKKSGKREIIPFSEEYRIGNVYSILVEGINPSEYLYNFLEEGREEADPYAKVIAGNEIWGKKVNSPYSGILLDDYDWEGDAPLHRSFDESIFYQLHVRGYTRHSSSGVKNKGTFEGIQEKIPYFQELGITTLELLPAYEFLEWEKEYNRTISMGAGIKNGAQTFGEESSGRINYWGYKKAFYFAPKSSFCGSKNCSFSFKTMVKELHRAGLELVMQFYFEPETPQVYLLEVLRFWVQEYHVDGFRLLGAGIPMELLASDPVLYNTKLLYEALDGQKLYEGRRPPVFLNLAMYNESYLYAVRHFLKGDVGTLGKAFERMVFHSKWMAYMVYLTNYNTFTLKDLVSYDRKHNEENGEEGRDGISQNISWNCGAEGPTRRKSIVTLRNQQMRNALVMMFFSRGTPIVLSGDEFANSQGGNNNPYCQDNLVSWLNWKDLEREREFFSYTKKVISLRKQLRMVIQQSTKEEESRTGYPGLSFHGKEAWKLNWDGSNEEAGGILFYHELTYLYVCINMYWQETRLAIPNLPGNRPWEMLLDTSLTEKEGILENNKSIIMPPRSIKIILAKGKKSDFEEGISAF